MNVYKERQLYNKGCNQRLFSLSNNLPIVFSIDLFVKKMTHEHALLCNFSEPMEMSSNVLSGQQSKTHQILAFKKHEASKELLIQLIY